ncbi:MAG: radical SAM protein [Bacillota bacterium]|nr:radical SAM protein [Bacillota bacterium]
MSRAAGCGLCPRACGAPRTPDQPGWCGSDEGFSDFRVARLMDHHWEEPFISGVKGSGTVFFTGCALGCCFCQNQPISRGHQGDRLTPDQLLHMVVSLLQTGVHNLNLVTPSHYADRIPAFIAALRQTDAWKHRPVPIIWNSSAYETVASLRQLAGTIDIYLPDMKFFDVALSRDLAKAPDYAEIARAAILEMLRQQPAAAFGSDGLLTRGVVIRHLVLPGHWRDSCRILAELASLVPGETPLSIMCQYTPQAQLSCDGHPELQRRLTTWEYRKVLDCALDLGFNNLFVQERSSADPAYTPDFSARFRPGRT